MAVYLLLIASLVTLVSSQQYVWNLLKPALTADEVQAILTSKDNRYPTYNEIPDTDFSCASKAQPGFYADVQAGCQVFHRCDLNGNMTSYLCVNTTLFNQITLVCDFFYNVDCGRATEFENFANSRLYTDRELFDTPPADWVMPGSADTFSNADQGQQNANVKPAATTKKPAATTTTRRSAGGAKGGAARASASASGEQAQAGGTASVGNAGQGANGQSNNNQQGQLNVTITDTEQE